MTMEDIMQSTMESVITEKFSYFENQVHNLILEVTRLNSTIGQLLKKSNPEEKLTVKEAAEILRVKENTVRDMCKSDKISYEKLGGQFRIKRSAINDYLNRHI
ncbi:helix-turn-helix domain-containing protein [Cyclobacterium roseum]|uniref:helix-turn-helix domain-containing protein n=1 Tax=Cyclobacterium roseum TaxID=2666137 RepID=UPI001391DAF6|nr:helix-turn-helix domain-containing protein [Cyclobacterium roseum]